VLAADLLADTHGPGDIDREDNTNVLLAHHFLVKDLSRGLHDIVDFSGFRDFFRLKHDGVLGIAELASPYLLFLTVNLSFLVLTKYVESSITSFAKYGITSSQF
jgi:hypothetical protein